MKLLFLTLQLGTSLAFQNYQQEFPNGDNIPNPCGSAGSKWAGVGHTAVLGGGARNSFGRDFARYRSWTRAFCQADSDGDGQSNGEELGDPNCTWRKGSRPQRSTNIKHPGICELVGSSRCASTNSWLKCDRISEGFDCPAIAREKAKYIDFRMPAMRMPSDETNYFCMKFTLPSDQDYQFIAMEPLIDNVDVYHHALLYACSTQAEQDTVDEMYSRPQECGMAGGAASVCTSMVQAWGVGDEGWCGFDNVGIPFGRSTYSKVVMEIHWNNMKRRSDIIDRSGMRVYYIPRSRPNDLGIVTVAQDMLILPPGKPDVIAEGKWLSECTSRTLEQGETYYLTQAGSHMHLLGSYSKLVLKRKTGQVLVLIDGKYDYNTPNFWMPEDKPLELYPGDELVHTCHFNTTQRRDYTFAGMGTSDEMCNAFFMLYPQMLDEDKRPMLDNYIYSIADVGFCEMEKNDLVRGCDWFTLTESALQTVARACAATEFPPRSCPARCRNALINTNLMNNPCMKPPVVYGVFIYEVLPGDPKAHIFASVIELCQCRENRKCVEMASRRHRGEMTYSGIEVTTTSTAAPVAPPSWYYRWLAYLNMLQG